MHDYAALGRHYKNSNNIYFARQNRKQLSTTTADAPQCLHNAGHPSN